MFKSGLVDFLRSGVLSDVTLVISKKRYRLHRLILAYSSDFFSSMLSSEFKESNQQEIELKFPDPKNVFPDVLQFMYAGRLEITAEKVIAILAQAEQYLIKPLIARCREFVATHLNRATVISLVVDSFAFHQDDIVDQCLLFLATNFLHMATSTDYTALEPVLFLKLVNHDRLAVNDEWVLYQTVNSFVTSKKKLAPEMVPKMFESVRYRWLSYKQLTEVVANEAIPRPLIIDSLMARLHSLEAPKTRLKLTDRQTKREWKGAHFEVQTKADGMPPGIISWLSRNCGRSNWQNPVSAGVMNVVASSIERGKASFVIDETPQEFWTAAIPASWVAIDMNKYKVLPRAYALRHGGNYRADSLRNWDLQGSVDGVSWVQLKKHYNDDSINGPFDVKIFIVEKVETSYRLFRILQTGHNSSGRNFLAVSGFEVYGDVWGPSTPIGEED